MRERETEAERDEGANDGGKEIKFSELLEKRRKGETQELRCSALAILL